MVKIDPFRATTLNPESQDLNGCVCPVYDTISEESFDDYAKCSENVIHFTTRRAEVSEADFIKYAKDCLDSSFKDGLLIESDEPAIYIYGIRYRPVDGVLSQLPVEDRRDVYFTFGLVALVEVDELGRDSIVGHEEVFRVNTMERYNLMNECRMNFSPILAEYNMPDHTINNIFEDYLGFKRPNIQLSEDKMPIIDVTLNGARHLLWEVTDSEIIGKVQDLIEDEEIMILDGHHRYTASENLKKNDGVDSTMMMLVEGGDRALLLLPWHRCVRTCDMDGMWDKIRKNFVIESYDKESTPYIYSKLSRKEADYAIKIGMYDGEKFYILKLARDVVEKISDDRGEKIGLDLIVLQDWLIDPFIIGEEAKELSFSPLPSEVTGKVDNKECNVAFIMNRMDISDVEDKAHKERKSFPQKSTRFLPKVAEGIIMRRFSTDG